MGYEYEDLPGWEFTTLMNEVGIATYTVRAVRDGGVTGETTGDDVDVLLDKMKRWAATVDQSAT